MSYMQIDNLVKQYGQGDAAVLAVKGMTFEIQQGEFVAVMGESGSGKSTLLSMMGALNSPTSGRYVVDDIDVYSLGQDDRAEFRREFLGFIFQSFHLIPYLTVAENVMLPLTTVNIKSSEKLAMAKDALAHVSLSGKEKRLPGEISGGEQERVAIARAIVNNPTILLADEPTGNLDSKTSQGIMDLFSGLNRDGMTIIMVTHSLDCGRDAERILGVADGLLIEEDNFSGAEDSILKEAACNDGHVPVRATAQR
ncbi:MAG: ABC transporter ATP-binding protein [Deltaproteobacteria bacterium]|nr:ABC transporter ATP-binding protein [Deltaproteobacteria bacterium]